MSGRVKAFDLGPVAIDACDTDHSSHRPDAVEWATSHMHLREAMQTRSGRFMPAADLPGHGWVHEVTDLMLAMPWRGGDEGPGLHPGLVAALQRAWQTVEARGASSVRVLLELPGSPRLVVDMCESDAGLEVRVACADDEAVRWLSSRIDLLGADLQQRLQRRVCVSVVHQPDMAAPLVRSPLGGTA